MIICAIRPPVHDSAVARVARPGELRGHRLGDIVAPSPTIRLPNRSWISSAVGSIRRRASSSVAPTA